ncbi:pkd-2 [Symbiodinium natans]|uniref:Pkd-2 protein n=1 Tax=Symbiodinium natans TaxID=878477 RepID=A0A812SGN4_9DINO|nr:pkd-2 [Symbiodinium natans]
MDAAAGPQSQTNTSSMCKVESSLAFPAHAFLNDGSAAKAAKDELEKLVSQADPSTAVWRPLLQKLMTAADDSPSPSAGLQDCLDRSCAKLRAADYEAFRQSLRSSALANDPLQGWRQRLVAEGYGAARDTALPIEAAEKEAAENQEALTQVESMVPEGSGVVFLCQSGSFMYDLQVASSVP